MPERIPFKEVEKYIEMLPDLDVGREHRVNHNTDSCSGSSECLSIRRKDNGFYSLYCYRCGSTGYYKDGTLSLPSKGIGSSDSKYGTSHTPDRLHTVSTLPSDAVSVFTDFPVREQLWIKRGRVTEDEVTKHGIVYSPYWRRVCFPLYRGDALIGWQGRCVVSVEGEPKYITRIAPEHRESMGVMLWTDYDYDPSDPSKESDSVVLVEDFLSGIRCSRFIDTVVLLGTSINNYIITNIINYSIIYIFLDNDNPIVKKKQLLLANQLSTICRGEVRVIRHTHDPKELCDAELNEILTGGVM